MKESYKNKRDFYKDQYEKTASELDKVKKILSTKEKNQNDRYYTTVFCTNCRYVCDVSIPNGLQIIDGDCTKCRVRSDRIAPTLFQVVSYPNKF